MLFLVYVYVGFKHIYVLISYTVYVKVTDFVIKYLEN